MIKKILAALTVVGVVTLGLATPADARGRSHHRILTGDMELVLNAGIGDPTSPHPNVSWTGTWHVGGHRTYDIVFFSIVPPTDIGDTGWAYWVEDVALYDAGTIERDADGVVTQFEVGDYVMYGNDAGVGHLPTNINQATGFVTDVQPHLDDHRKFESDDVGNRLGFVGELDLVTMTAFDGTFSVAGVK